MEKKPAYWNDYFLTDVSVYDLTDWKGQTPPGKRDFDNINIYQAREALYRAIERTPSCPNPDSPGPHPWVQTMLKCICRVLVDPNDRLFEEQVMRSYLQVFGMDQLLRLHGININYLKEEINNMLKSQ